MTLYRHTAVTILALLITAAPLLSGARNNTPASEQQRLLTLLQSNAELFDKARACQRLALIGDARAVPVLAELLQDEFLSGYARFALEPIEDPGVDDALRSAMTKLKDSQLAGVVTSIGARRDAKAVPALAALVRDPSSGVAPQALAALARIATDKAVETILQTLNSSSAPLRNSAADACLKTAQQQLAAGKADQAARLFEAVGTVDLPKQLHAAAVYGAVLARGTEAAPLLIEQLRSNDPAIVEIALRAARQLPGPKVTEALTAELDRARPAMQIMLIQVLVDRNDSNTRDAIQAIASSKDPAVRAESLRQLAKIGDASAVPVFIKAAKAGGEQAEIALAGLRTVSGEGVEQAIIDAVKSADNKLRPDLIDVMTYREYRSAMPVFLEQARSEDPAAARAALRGIARLSGYQDLSKTIDVLVETPDQTVREQALRAVVAITRTSVPSHEATINKLLLRRLDETTSVPAACTLIRALAAVPSDASLDYLRQASEDDDPQVRDAAVRTIADYPDPAAAELLLNIFKTTQNRAHRIVALQGCIRLCRTTDIPVEQALNLYRQAITRADSPAEQKLILSGLAEVTHPDALAIALDAMKQPAIRPEASLTIITLARKTAAIDPAAAQNAAKALLLDPDLKNLHDQARQVINLTNSFEDFLVAWQVSGPYAEEGKNYSQLLNIPFDPETGDNPVSWRLASAGADPQKPCIVDLLAIYGGQQRAAYARTWIHAEKSVSCTLNIGSDDSVKAWLNGKLVHTKDAPRAAVVDSDKVPVNLSAGWNSLMLKVTQNNSAWQFCARIRADDGSPLDGIRPDPQYPGRWPAPAGKPVRIFDGKTFTGWQGNLDIFRIEDGSIVGGTLKEPIKQNEFLTAETEYADFQLSLKVKLLGENANAGIQIRSRRIPNHNEMIGYQADMGQQYWGCLYDESRRGKVLAAADRPELDKVLKQDDWNLYVIRCRGKQITLSINGYQTVDYTEPDDQIEQTGLIGLQIHGGGPSEAWYKDIEITELP